MGMVRGTALYIVLNKPLPSSTEHSLTCSHSLYPWHRGSAHLSPSCARCVWPLRYTGFHPDWLQYKFNFLQIDGDDMKQSRDALSYWKQMCMLLKFGILFWLVWMTLGLLAVPKIIDFRLLFLSLIRWWIHKRKQRHTPFPSNARALWKQSAAFIDTVLSGSTLFIFLVSSFAMALW